MTTFTEEELKQAYQLGYSHGANGKPPLDGAQVVEVAALGQARDEPTEGKPE